MEPIQVSEGHLLASFPMSFHHIAFEPDNPFPLLKKECESCCVAFSNKGDAQTLGSVLKLDGKQGPRHPEPQAEFTSRSG